MLMHFISHSWDTHTFIPCDKAKRSRLTPETHFLRPKVQQHHRHHSFASHFIIINFSFFRARLFTLKCLFFYIKRNLWVLVSKLRKKLCFWLMWWQNKIFQLFNHRVCYSLCFFYSALWTFIERQPREALNERHTFTYNSVLDIWYASLRLHYLSLTVCDSEVFFSLRYELLFNCYVCGS